MTYDKFCLAKLHNSSNHNTYMSMTAKYSDRWMKEDDGNGPVQHFVPF